MKKVMTRLALAALFMFAFVVTANQVNAGMDAEVKAVHTAEMPVTLFQLPNGKVVGFVDDTQPMIKTHAGKPMNTDNVKSLGLFSSIKKAAGTALSVGGAVLGGLGGSLMGGGEAAPAQ